MPRPARIAEAKMRRSSAVTVDDDLAAGPARISSSSGPLLLLSLLPDLHLTIDYLGQWDDLFDVEIVLSGDFDRPARCGVR
jgi:hypothetical protein